MQRRQVFISIHAPRTGSDTGFQKLVKVGSCISIHAPRTGSDADKARARYKERLISIHAPRTGSDGSCKQLETEINISIHAPRTGSDPQISQMQTSRCYFNPRSPHGERRIVASGLSSPMPFQSTLPARGATSSYWNHLFRRTFQSTLPARGATSRTVCRRFSMQFQSTLPARGATQPGRTVI